MHLRTHYISHTFNSTGSVIVPFTLERIKNLNNLPEDTWLTSGRAKIQT